MGDAHARFKERHDEHVELMKNLLELGNEAERKRSNALRVQQMYRESMSNAKVECSHTTEVLELKKQAAVEQLTKVSREREQLTTLVNNFHDGIQILEERKQKLTDKRDRLKSQVETLAKATEDCKEEAVACEAEANKWKEMAERKK